MALKCLLIFLFTVNVVQPLSLRIPESPIDGSSNNQGNSVLKLSEDVQILGDDGVDAVQKIVQRVERKLHNSRLSDASPRRSLPMKMETKYDDSVATETKDGDTGRQIQQWQVAVVVPPGLQQPGGLPPAMQGPNPQGPQSPPGSIWIQIPGYYSHNSPNYYPGQQPTPVELSPPIPSEESLQTDNEQPSNEHDHVPDENNDYVPQMPTDENHIAPEEETNDSSEVISVPENEMNPLNESDNENHEAPNEDNSENSVGEGSDQIPPEIESENSGNPYFMNNNEPHREEESNNNNYPEVSDKNNENQYPYPNPDEDQNNPPQEHEEAPVPSDGTNDSSNINNHEESVVPTMNMSPKQQENEGQMNGGEPEMVGGVQPGNVDQTDNSQNEITNGNNGVEEVSTVSNVAYYCSRGQYPSENSCSKFINCWDGKAYEQECPAGLLFSPQGFCDFRENVNCGNRPNEGPKNITDCSIPYGTYRNPKNCSEFFVCVYRNPIKFACEHGLVYNNDIGVCDYPYKVNCYNTPSSLTADVSMAWSTQPTPERENYPENAVIRGGKKRIGATGHNQVEEQPMPQYDFRKVPAGLVDTGLKCRSGSVIPLGKGCGRVSVCALGGYSQLITCPQHTAYDSQAKRCISAVKAKC